VSDFKTLRVWQKAHALALNAHKTAMRLRGSHNSALRSQVIRAAMSIPTNVVEGTGQRTAREYARFVSIAINSASELEYHLMIARDLGAISVTEFDSLSSETLEVRKMLYGLLRALNRSSLRRVESTHADS
jgi:four helix bundle protein